MVNITETFFSVFKQRNVQRFLKWSIFGYFCWQMSVVTQATHYARCKGFEMQQQFFEILKSFYKNVFLSKYCESKMPV